MPGIVRIHIESDWKDWRTRMNRDLEPAADELHRNTFLEIGMPLQDGLDIVKCTKKEAEARYDWKEGIDCLLYFKDGTKATMQEKYLDYWMSTATFEETKTNGDPGVWYYCTAQYYFVGYARKYKKHNVRAFQDWIYIDYPGIHRLDKTTDLNWRFNTNKNDGRGARFRYLYFDDVPESVVIARAGIDNRQMIQTMMF